MKGREISPQFNDSDMLGSAMESADIRQRMLALVRRVHEAQQQHQPPPPPHPRLPGVS
jgi:hypothetical protein